MNKDDIEYAFRYAEQEARRSGDTSTKVGAVIVKNGSVRLGECNDLPLGVLDSAERRQRPEKYRWVHHAESRLIAVAAKMGIQTAGAYVFVTHTPCSNCTKVLIDAGIKTIYHDIGIFVGGQWEEEIRTTRIMCEEAGVELISRYADESA